MTIAVVYNPGSGSADSLADIKQAFATAGATPTYIPITEINTKLPPIIAQGTVTVAAAGGDGTVNSVAQHIVGSDACLAVIPAGTLNHFAKDLEIPLEIPDAVNVALNGSTTTVDVGRVNEQVFINNSSIGWYPRSLLTREQLSGRVGKWPAAVIGFARAVSRPRRYHLDLTIDGKQLHYRTPFVFIGNNAYKRAEPGVGQRETLQGGQLAIYIVKAQNFLGIMRMLVVGLFTRKQRTEDFSILHAQQCTINTKHHRALHVALDGEVKDLPTPLRYESQPHSLRVMIP